MIEISKTCTIDMGHRVTNHNSKCSNVHGHTYKIELFARGPLQTEGSSEGMVCDFSFLKIILGEIDRIFDHGFAVWYKDTNLLRSIGDLHLFSISSDEEGSLIALDGYAESCENEYVKDNDFGKVIVTRNVPTAENLASLWLSICRRYMKESDKNIPDGFELHKIRVWETPTSFCEVTDV